MLSSHLWNEGEKEGKENKEMTWLLVAIKLAWLVDCNLFIYLFNFGSCWVFVGALRLLVAMASLTAAPGP